MSGPDVRLIGGAVSDSFCSSATSSSASDSGETSFLGQKNLSEQPGGAFCSKPLRSRVKRAQQKSSHPIETMELPKNALQMLGEKVLKDVREFEQLWSYLLRSRTDSKCIIAAKNAIEALNSVGYSFSGKDLSGVNIPGANLSCGLFHRTNFTGANLEGVNFQRAYLEDALFVGANLRNIDFGQTYLNASSLGSDHCLAVFRDDIKNQTFMISRDLDAPEIHLWSLEEKRIIHSWDCGGFALSAAFTAGGKRIVTVTDDRCIRIWNFENGALLNTFKANYVHKKEIIECFSEGFLEKLLSNKCVENVLDYPDYVEVKIERNNPVWCSEKVLEDSLQFFREKIDVFDCTVSPNIFALRIACRNANGNIYVWDLNENRLVSFISEKRAYGKMCLTYDENQIIVTDVGSIKLLDIVTKEENRSWPSSQNPSSTVFSSNGRLFASIVGNTTIIRSFDDDDFIKVLELFPVPTMMAFSSRCQFLAIAIEREIRILRVTDWTIVNYQSDSNVKKITSLQFIDQDQLLISRYKDGGFKLWNLTDPIPKILDIRSELHLSSIRWIKPSLEGRRLFVYTYLGFMKIFDTKTGGFFEEVHCWRPFDFYENGDVLPNREEVRVTENFSLYRDNQNSPNQNKFVTAYPVHISFTDKGVLTRLCIYGGFGSYDDDSFFSFYNRETKGISVWRIDGGHIDFAFALTTGRIFLSRAGVPGLYNPENQDFERILEGVVTEEIQICSPASDERRFAMGLDNGSLVVWDSESGKHHFLENVHSSPIQTIKFCGNTVISISSHIHCWNPHENRILSLPGFFQDAWIIPGHSNFLRRWPQPIFYDRADNDILLGSCS